MLNILKKIPIIEITIILLLNIISCFIGGIEFVTALLIVDAEFSENDLANFINGAYFDVSWLGFIICVYVFLFKCSLNKAFLKTIYSYKYNKVARRVIFVILLFLSPMFWLSLLTFSVFCIIAGCCYSCIFPVILFSLYYKIAEFLYRKNNKIYICLKVITSYVLFLLLILFVYQCNVVFELALSYNEVNGIVCHLLILLVMLPFIVTDRNKAVIEYWEQRILYVFLFSTIIIGSVFYLSTSYYVRFHSIFLLIFLVSVLLFEKPILKLKAKNLALRKEIEDRY